MASRRSLLLTGPRQLAWVEEDLPPLRPDHLLVETIAGAISIGSELPHYTGRARHSQPDIYPRMTGYESVGRVLACGPAVRRFQPGSRVVAIYGHRTHAILPETKAISVPDGISDALALLAILTCDVAKGIRKLAPQPDERVLITGAGALGLLTLFMLRALTVEAVDLVDLRPERRTLALQLGARQALSPEAMSSYSHTYPVALECSSRNAALALLQAHMEASGRICILADGNLEPLVLTPHFHEKELHLVGSSDGWDYPTHAAWYFQFVQTHPTALEQLFQLTITPNELPATFEQLATGTIAPVKVLVRYQPDAPPVGQRE